MKTTRLITFFFLISISFYTKDVFSQCAEVSPTDLEQLLDKCSSQAGENIFLKAYRIKLKQSEKNKPKQVNYSYLFTFGKKYTIYACSSRSSKSNLIVELYNSAGLIASTYDPKSKMNLPGIEFTCMKTGMYTLIFYFEDGVEGCGVAVLSFKQM